MMEQAEPSAEGEPLRPLLGLADGAGAVDVAVPCGIGQQVEDRIGGRGDQALDGLDVGVPRCRGVAHARDRTPELGEVRDRARSGLGVTGVATARI